MMDIIDFLLFLHKRMLIHRMLRFMILGNIFAICLSFPPTDKGKAYF